MKSSTPQLKKRKPLVRGGRTSGRRVERGLVRRVSARGWDGEMQHAAMAVLREERERRVISLTLLKELTGISRQELSNLERGKNRPLLETFFCICEGLRIAPERVIASAQRWLAKARRERKGV